jgi:CelD/BcsL family acetyltransferase involved in cellulose biosynthesis
MMNKIIKIDPATDPLWEKLVAQQKSDVFHSPGWIKVLKDTYNFNVEALVSLNSSGEPQAGIVYSMIEDMMDPRIASLPFSDFCDPLVRDFEDWDSMISILLKEDCRIRLRVLHNAVPLEDRRFPMVNRAKWHAVNLQQDIDGLWGSISGSARRAINKASRNDIEIRSAKNKDDLRKFFKLHLGVRKYKYQLVAQPYAFFENIWDQFIAKGHGVLMLADYQDETIAGVLFLEWQNILYYKFNASKADYTGVRPNDSIVWKAIEYGVKKNLHYLDFGLSDWDQEGLLRYKRKYATEEKTISFLQFTPEIPQSAAEKQMRSLLPKLTDLFVNESVPDSVTEKAGEVLYRYFT